jgi:RNase P subunit RPR2
MVEMLVTTSTTLALFCPHCGKLDYHTISQFQFSGYNSVNIYCECGQLKVSITSKQRKQYLLHIDCIVCETKHFIPFSAKQFWADEVTRINCTDVTVELGFVGPREMVEDSVNKCHHELQDIVSELGFDDYFVNPEIMYEVLNVIHDIAEQGGLFCQCGALQIGVEILPEELELTCTECNGVLHVPAKNEADLNALRNVDQLEVPAKRRRRKK